MYTLTTGTSAHMTSLLPMPPAKSVIMLHMAHVFIDPPPGVPFKISMPSPMPPMVLAAIIEYAPNVRWSETSRPASYYVTASYW